MQQTNLVPTIAEDEGPEDQLAPFATSVDDDRNWAEDEEVKAYIRQHVYPLLDQTRNDMIPLHEEWKATARMTTLTHDSGQRYKGRSNVYVPSYAKAKKIIVKSIMQGVFPSDDVTSVTDTERPEDAETPNALAVKTYLQWAFKEAKLKNALKPGIGEFVDYGMMVIKFWQEKNSRGFKQGRKKFDLATQMTKDDYSYMSKKFGLRVSARSAYDFYIFPMNINDIEEATLVFEDLDVSIGYIKERGRTKEWVNIDKALNAPFISEHLNTQQDRQSDQQGSVTNPTLHAGSDLGEIRMITEIWCEIQLPDSAYMEDEEVIPVPCKIIMAGDEIMQCVRNPFWFQRHPYLVTRDDPKPGNFFSKGTGKLISGLQYLMNDFTNQMNDNGIMAMNPMIIYNPSTMAGPLTPIKPGGMWATTDVTNGIKFDRPPGEQIQYGQALIQLYAAMIADHAGAPPVLQGTKGGSTATSTQVLARNAANPLKDTIEDIENDILNPLMLGTWILAQQYMPEEYMIEVMGDTGGWRPKSQKKEQLCGDFLMRWLASSQAANAAQRAEQGMKLLSALTPPLVQLLMAAGWTVDPQPLLKRVVTDAMGYRDFDKMVKRAPMQMGPDGQPMPPGQPLGPPGMPPPPGGAPQPGQAPMVRSAAEQSNNPDPNASSMVNGEGDQLTALRQLVESETAGQGEQ